MTMFSEIDAEINTGKGGISVSSVDKETVTGQLMAMPTRAQPTSGLVNLQTGQLADDAANRKQHHVLIIRPIFIISIINFRRTRQTSKIYIASALLLLHLFNGLFYKTTWVSQH